MDFYERIIKDIDDIYASKLYKNIINYITKNDNDSINEFIDLLCLKFEYSNEIIKLMLEDKKLFISIIQRYREINKKNINSMVNSMILKSNTEQKIKYNKYNKIILSYLENNNHIHKHSLVKEEKFFPNLSWCRPNQKQSIEKSLNDQFSSGIDLHATGGGKTFIILAKAYYYNQIYNKNVIILCERKYILLNEFSNIHKVSKNIIDTDKINIINLSVNPCKKFYKKIIGTNNLIIINRSFISYNEKFKKLNDQHNVGLVLIDECHSSSASKTFEILKYFKDINCKLIGFSATPIRGNKISSSVKLFNCDNSKKINYIHNYSLFNAIIDYDPHMEKPYGCLPFKIFLYDNKDKHPEKIFEIINEYIKELHYKKIIIWFRKIDLCTEYYEYFEKHFINNEIKLFVSHNEINTCESDKEYIERESNCIMFCVNRFREGTNLNTLELGLLLDSDFNRGDIPTIQMCGRLVRFDSNNIKTYGKVIDFCSKSFILEKIIKYYIDLSNDENFNKIIDFIKSNIEVFKDKKQIHIKLNEKKKIELLFKSFEINWDTIKNELIEYVTSKYKYNIYRVPIGDKSRANFLKTIKQLKNPIWGCKEELVKNIKINDKLIFEIDNKLEIYNIINVTNDPEYGLKLWNDSIYSKILYLDYISSFDIDTRYKFLNKLIGYKEKYVPRTITPITNFTEEFNIWFQENILDNSENMSSSDDSEYSESSDDLDYK
jgi:superfamily II DNA or RNA helicase